MKKLVNLAKNEDGSVLIIAALILTVLLGMAAFVIDVGSVYLAKSELQNAADSAALAGAQSLPSSSSAVSAAAYYAKINGLDTDAGDTITTTAAYNGDANQIEVVCTRTVAYTFARVFGLTGKEVSVRAVAEKAGAGAAFDYTVFSGSSTTALTFYGSDLYIGGGIHSNNKFIMYGSSETITGSCESVSTFTFGGSSLVIGGTCQGSSITINGSSISIGSRVSSAAPSITMPDFSAEIIAEAKAAGKAYVGDLTFNGDKKNVDSPIYVNGNLTINGSQFTGTGIVIVSGNITFNGDNVSNSSNSNVCFYSMNGNITINGSNADLDGLVYAPKGTVNMNGSNQVINGRVIANSVVFNGSNIRIVSGDDDLDSLPSASVKLVA